MLDSSAADTCLSTGVYGFQNFSEVMDTGGVLCLCDIGDLGEICFCSSRTKTYPEVAEIVELPRARVTRLVLLETLPAHFDLHFFDEELLMIHHSKMKIPM